MLLCETCGETFPEEELRVIERTEWFETWGTKVTHTFEEVRCPYCGGEELRERKDDVEAI